MPPRASAALLRRRETSSRYRSRSSVSQLSGRDHGIVLRASSPHSPSSPISSPANTIGTPGLVICSPTPTSCRSRDPATVRNRAVSWLSRIAHEWSTPDQGTPARKRRIVSTRAVPGKRGMGTGRPRNSVASSPGRSSPRSHVHTGRVKPAYAIVPCHAAARRSARASCACSATTTASGRAATAVATTPSATSAFRSRSCRRPVMFATSIRQPSSEYGASSQRATTDDPFP